jgi:DNA helicase-2/ATP-dependent DNA helicase PcrA
MTLLTTAIAELDSSQTAAFEVDDNCAVTAPPGSGKTRLLVTKLAHVLDSRVRPPQGAACITLTNNAATEIQDRFRAISADTRDNLFIGTVHSFALQRVIRPFASLLGRPNLLAIRIGSEAELDDLWSRALATHNLENRHDPMLRASIDKYRQLMVQASDWHTLGASAYAIKETYVDLMDNSAVLDFRRLVEIAVDIIEHEAVVRDTLRAQFPWIFVDEYQDLAPGLDSIVKALAFGEGDFKSILFAVGDVDQAIYKWTGTDPDLLTQLAARSDVIAKRLETNYRSGSHLVQVSRRLFDDDLLPLTLREGGRISLHKIDDGIDGQAEFIAAKASEIIEQGTERDEIAVFCATNLLCEEVARVVEGSGHPVFYRRSDPWETSLSIALERLAAWATHGQDESGHNIDHLVSDINRCIPGLPAANVRNLRALAIVAEPADSAQVFINEARAALSGEAATEVADAVLTETAGLVEALESIDSVGLTLFDLGSRRVTAGKIYITTSSASKGMEFDVTFVVGLEDSLVPHYYARSDPEQLAEERRKFYVAITRAREHVYLLWTGYSVNKYGKRFPGPVSRFVADLGVLTE